MTNQSFGTTFPSKPKPSGYMAGNFYSNLVDQAMGGPPKKSTYQIAASRGGNNNSSGANNNFYSATTQQSNTGYSSSQRKRTYTEMRGTHGDTSHARQGTNRVTDQ